LALNKDGLNSNRAWLEKGAKIKRGLSLAAYLLHTDLVTSFLTILVPPANSRKSGWPTEFRISVDGKKCYNVIL